MVLHGSPIYKMLDTVNHQELRLALGAFRTSPVTVPPSLEQSV